MNYLPPDSTEEVDIQYDWSAPAAVMTQLLSKFGSLNLSQGWLLMLMDEPDTKHQLKSKPAQTPGASGVKKAEAGTISGMAHVPPKGVDCNGTFDVYVADGAAYVNLGAYAAIRRGEEVKGLGEGHRRIPMRPWPVIVTKYVGVGAEGTEFVIQASINGDTAVQRVFLLDKPLEPLRVGLRVANAGEQGMVELKDQYDYAEFDLSQGAGQKLVAKSDYRQVKELNDFVTEVVKEANLLMPSKWP
jgi:hypothetical protein